MTPQKLDEQLSKITCQFQRRDTHMRNAIPAKKSEVTLRYLVTGDSYASLECLYRVSCSTICTFLSEVFSAACDTMKRVYSGKKSITNFQKLNVSLLK
jgi:hypothetical protein